MTDVGNGTEPLERQLAKLQKINSALMSRVERSMDHQLNGFSLFETAIALDNKVRHRTRELQQALRSIERTNEELSRAKRQADAANSLKSSFVTSVSHDLLQPLNAARLALSALAEVPMPGQGGTLVMQVERALATLENLLRTLLDLSKLDAGVLKPDLRAFPIDEVLAALRHEFAPFATTRGLSLRIRPSTEIVVSDQLLLRRILQNLVANALRYTRRGGVLLGCRRRGDRVRVDVIDTGPGIPSDRREAIFLEFQRDNVGTEVQAGFGLGLAIVRRLALALDHPIGLSSRLGHGSNFSVSLPRTTVSAAVDELPQQRRLRVSRNIVRGAKILLIENEASVLEAMEALLTNWECDVATATSGSEARERIKALGAAPDAIIVDLHLDNGERGFDVLRALWEIADVRVPAFVVTADYSPSAAEEAASLGLEVLKKPINPAELRSLLSFVLS